MNMQERPIVERLLARLHGVHATGNNSWRTDCPNGHTKSRGSLSITEADDGRVLLHCFACTDTQSILRALGLAMTDLFPERIDDPSPQARHEAQAAFKRQAWAAALSVLDREATVVAIAAQDISTGKALAAADLARVVLAAERIHQAREVLT